MPHCYLQAKKKFCVNTFVYKIRNFYDFSNPSKISNSMGQAASNAVFHVQIGWFLTKCHVFGGFSVFGPKKAPCKKIQKNRSAIPYEFWLPFIWIQPFDSRTPTHMRWGGAPSPLHCIPSIGVYIYICIDIIITAKSLTIRNYTALLR